MKNRRIANIFAFAVLACLAANALAQNKTPRYKLTDLGALSDFPYSRAYGLNDKGQVVGQVAKLEPKLEAHAVLWDGDKVREIEVPQGLKFSAARGINDKGEVVGGFEIENYGSHGFHIMGLPDQAYLWQDGEMSVLSSETSHAYAINKSGQIAGELKRAGEFKSSATIWQDGKPTKLNTPREFWSSSARAINNKGWAAGIVSDKGKRRAALWSDGKMQLLGTLPEHDQSIVGGINDSGQVVGSSGKDNSYWDLPFLWGKGEMKMLAPLEGSAGHNEVWDINNRGQIVGCGMKNQVYMRAVLWENGAPNDLNNLIAAGSGLVLSKATAINNKGQIVGEASDSQIQTHAFLLTPIDEALDK